MSAPPSNEGLIRLRPYQAKAVDDIRLCYRKGLKSVLFYLPTGGGKTYTFSYIADSAAKRNGQVIIAVHRKELLMQSAMSLAKLGVEHSIIAPAGVVAAIKIQQVRELGRSFVKNNSHVAVGSIQTIVRRLPTISKPTLIILDEAHHAVAGQWRQLLEYFPDARVLGVTATPCRSDDKGLGRHVGGVFDDMVMGPTPRELMHMGSLVYPKIYMPEINLDLTGVRITRSGDYNHDQLEEAMSRSRPTIVGDAVTWYKAKADGKRAIVFCASVKAAQATAEAFCNAGYKFKSLDGTMDDSERRLTVRQLESGEIHGITSCDIVSEGFDCPGAEVAILMRPTNSESLYLQQVGRVLRPAPGKQFGIIIDMVGNTTNPNLGGPPHWDREWSLDGGLEADKRNSDKEQLLVQIRTCKKCGCTHDPAPKCPECGFVYKIKERKLEKVDGDLIEMTPEMEAELAAKRKKRVEVGRARTLEDLLVIEKARGYRPGWAHHMMNARSSR